MKKYGELPPTSATTQKTTLEKTLENLTQQASKWSVSKWNRIFKQTPKFKTETKPTVIFIWDIEPTKFFTGFAGVEAVFILTEGKNSPQTLEDIFIFTDFEKAKSQAEAMKRKTATNSVQKENKGEHKEVKKEAKTEKEQPHPNIEEQYEAHKKAEFEQEAKELARRIKKGQVQTAEANNIFENIERINAKKANLETSQQRMRDLIEIAQDKTAVVKLVKFLPDDTVKEIIFKQDDLRLMVEHYGTRLILDYEEKLYTEIKQLSTLI